MKKRLPLYVAFALAVAIMAGVGWNWYRGLIAVREADRWENHTYEVMLQGNKLLAALTDAETSQRNFLLTGGEEHIQLFNGALPQVDQAFAALRTLTKGQPRQQQRLDSLEPLTRARLASLKEVVELRRTRGPEAAMDAVKTKRGISLMDEVRREVGEFQAEEDRLLRERRLAKEASLARTFRLGVAGGILSGAFMLVGFLGLKRQQGAIRATEVRYRRLFEAAHDGVLLLDAHSHKITDANPFITQLLGYSRDELLGQELWQIGLLHDVQASRTAFDTLTREGHIRYENLPLRAKTGEAREVEFVSNVYDQDGRSVIQCNIRDITEHRRAERQLHQQALLLRLAPVLARDLDDHITVWTEGIQKLYGWSSSEALGALSHQLLHTQFPAPLGQIRARLFRDGSWEGELHRTRKGGQPITVLSLWVLRRNQAGEPCAILEANTDITQRKQVESERTDLRDQLAADLAAMNRLHALGTRFLGQEELPSLLDGILAAAIANIGAAKGNVQLLDPPSGELAIAIQRGFDQPFIEFFSHIRAGQAACGTAMQTKQCVIVEDVTLSPLFLAQPRALQLMLTAGAQAVVCTPLLTRAAQLVGVLSVHFPEPHRPTERDLRLLDLLARQVADFIEHTQGEQALRSARQELVFANANLEQKVCERTAKLEEAVAELEHFSYTITHDMRAPLRAMRSFGVMLMAECAGCLHEDRLDLIRRVSDAALRMDHLITDALQYSRAVRLELQVQPTDPAAVLRGILESYPQFQPPYAEITLAPDLPHVLANEAALTQVFSNLLGNAVKFVTPGHTPKVTISAELRSDPSTLNQPPSTQWVRFCVQDNGIGIPPEYHGKIWQMFQRLSKTYEGTGIGLALVRKVVERMNGKVGVESEPGRGSRFWVELPYTQQPASPYGQTCSLC